MITGSSRGLGAALAAELLQQGACVVGIARTGLSAEQSAAAARYGGRLRAFAYDLTQTEGIDALLGTLLQSVEARTAASLTLINNAGRLAPIAPAGRMDPAELQLSLQLNLLAPMLLTNAFLRHAAALPAARKQVVNVSSGAGRKPYPGWSAYCAAKAGLDHFTRVVAAEQGEGPGATRLMSLAPGVVDTDMQAEIRASSADSFPQLERFVRLFEDGQLQSPEATARHMVRLLRDPVAAQAAVLDLRDFIGPSAD
ncbi:SDR family NAD(P)-dependent oxidoreductase [Paenibacillus athensensis]|uniref:Short-chain dehydrogenase n=2 Tax=Paenibacillus athensensis TaxID=1967502 RepID=A0A4Y8PWQ6_9BACL|nr:SDR family NAD(P)-dependent oxidoreductase [Paenibacillus athensensis]